MTFTYDDSLDSGQLEAYERLLYDAMHGDQMLFTDAAGIERLWQVSTPLLENPPRLHRYPKGSWGPAAAQRLIAPRDWCLPEAAASVSERASRRPSPPASGSPWSSPSRVWR